MGSPRATYFRVITTPAFAQDQAATARTAAGCGPSQVRFDVKLDVTLHVLAQPEAGQTIVYVFEEDFSGPTMRIGVDGSWADLLSSFGS